MDETQIMNVGEVIEKLKKFPDHFECEVYLPGHGERDDMRQDVVDVVNCSPLEKIVSFEIPARLVRD